MDHNPLNITILNKPGATKALGGGSCAKRLAANNWNPNALRTNNTLLYNEWLMFDNVIIQIARERLVMANELMSRGLTYPIPNALGVIQLQWQRSGDLTPAEVSMNGLVESDKDLMDFDYQTMPIPMIHKEFQLDLRTLEVSRRGGMPLDTAQAEVATRKVAEMIEQIIFTGLSINANLGAIYGLTTAVNRVTGSVSAAWATAATGIQIVFDVIAMQNALNAKNMYGPYLLIAPTATVNAMAEDYKANGDLTIIQRVLQIPGIEGILPSNRITGTTVLLVQMTADVIQLIDGIQPMLVEWDERGGFELNFMIFAIMLPRIRSDYLGQCGIAHWQ